MVDSPVVCPALVLLAVVSVALVLVLVLRREEKLRTADARHAPSIYSPTMGRPAGSASRPPPAMKSSCPTATGSLRGQVSEIDYDIVPGRRMSLRTAKDRADALPRRLFLTWHLRMYSSTTLTVSP